MFWLFVMVVPLAVLFSAALLAISLFARSFKEAQSYISPLTILVLMPAVISVLPGVDLDLRLSLIPVLNTSLVSKEIVSGTYHWNYIALIFLSSCVYAGAALWVAIRLFQREDVLFRRNRLSKKPFGCHSERSEESLIMGKQEKRDFLVAALLGMTPLKVFYNPSSGSTKP